MMSRTCKRCSIGISGSNRQYCDDCREKIKIENMKINIINSVHNPGETIRDAREKEMMKNELKIKNAHLQGSLGDYADELV